MRIAQWFVSGSTWLMMKRDFCEGFVQVVRRLEGYISKICVSNLGMSEGVKIRGCNFVDEWTFGDFAM